LRAFVGSSIIREYPLQSCCWSVDHVLPNQSKFSIYTATVEKWVEILALAQRWVFKEVEQLCIRELQKLSIAPIEKIHIYQAFLIDRSLLAESFAKLTVRSETLNLAEGHKLGIETSLQVAQAREHYRSSSSGDLHLVLHDVFGFEEEALDFLVANSLGLMRILLTFSVIILRRRISRRRRHITPRMIPRVIRVANQGSSRVVNNYNRKLDLLGRCAPIMFL
jgi:hypothetical protein